MAAPTTGQKVLVCIDDSEQAKKALDYYVNFLHRAGNDVIVTHCIEMPYIPERESLAARPDQVSRILGEAREKANKVEDTYIAMCKEKGISIKVLLSDFDRNPGHFICDIASKENVGLVVMGCRGLGKIRRTLMGSVSDYVVHHAHCPVTVVRQ